MMRHWLPSVRLTLLAAIVPFASGCAAPTVQQPRVTGTAVEVRSGGEPGAAPAAAADDWVGRVRSDHPRLFFNRESWPRVKQAALGGERALFEEIRATVDAYGGKQLESADYGQDAALAAFVYLVTEQADHLEIARKLLRASVSYYHECYQKKKSVSWYSFSRINAWAAYDWLYNSLDEGERRELGASLLEATALEQPTDQRERFDRWENWLPPTSGFYSTPGLLWYAGVAMHGEGVDDERALQFMKRGYELYHQLLKFRSSLAGDDGGSASASLNYSLGAYPWAEFNFFHTFLSATGENLASDWPYMGLLPGYLHWNWLPGKRWFATGDGYHTPSGYQIPLGNMHMHLAQIMHFYAEEMPREAAFARWIQQNVDRSDRTPFRFSRFLVADAGARIEPEGPPRDPVRARHFEQMGQIFFRSGSGPDDTYASLTAGGIASMHRHYDHNNFVIFKKGLLALDSGTRTEVGIHLNHYYARSVAHNVVTIEMPGEEMPDYWGYLAPGEVNLPYPNDGGQRKIAGGSTVKAFETNEHFSYVASDATAAYHEAKCRLALRQFVFVHPNYFVIFDRVESTDPSYVKRWLLHTAHEPRFAADGRTFRADHDGGRLFSRTLLPRGARIETVGGPGKQFWSGDRNWLLPEGNDNTHPLLGQWRVEAYPGEPAKTDYFLHLIQVGDQGLEQMAESELIEDDGRAGVRFQVGEKTWEVVFQKQGPAGGHMKITGRDGVILQRPLSSDVAAQRGPFGG